VQDSLISGSGDPGISAERQEVQTALGSLSANDMLFRMRLRTELERVRQAELASV
jgi:hypothetical protein